MASFFSFFFCNSTGALGQEVYFALHFGTRKVTLFLFLLFEKRVNERSEQSGHMASRTADSFTPLHSSLHGDLRCLCGTSVCQSIACSSFRGCVSVEAPAQAAVCRCAESLQRVLPAFFLDSISVPPQTSPLDAKSLLYEELLAAFIFTPAMWPSAIAGYDVLIDCQGVWCDPLINDIQKDVSFLWSNVRKSRQAALDALRPSPTVCSSTYDDDDDDQCGVCIGGIGGYGIGSANDNGPSGNVGHSGADATKAVFEWDVDLSAGIAKLDAWTGVLWSVVLHTQRQPMLDHHCGPRAIILCATQAQCAEAAFLMSRLATALRLVVHNTFEQCPPMPTEKRADIVISTPLNLFQCCVLPQPQHLPNQGGADMCKASAFSAARRSLGLPLPHQLGGATDKLYRLDYCTQLAVLDVDGIVQIDTGCFLEAIFAAPSALPMACQSYFVCASDISIGVCRGLLHTRVATSVKKKDEFKRLARVGVALSGEGPCHNVGIKPSAGKRRRSEDRSELKPQDGDVALVLLHCLGASQVIQDPSILTDVIHGIADCVRDAAIRTELRIRFGALTCDSEDGTERHPTHVAIFVSFATILDSKRRCYLDLMASTFGGKFLDGNVAFAMLLPTRCFEECVVEHNQSCSMHEVGVGSRDAIVSWMCGTLLRKWEQQRADIVKDDASLASVLEVTFSYVLLSMTHSPAVEQWVVELLEERGSALLMPSRLAGPSQRAMLSPGIPNSSMKPFPGATSDCSLFVVGCAVPVAELTGVGVDVAVNQNSSAATPFCVMNSILTLSQSVVVFRGVRDQLQGVLLRPMETSKGAVTIARSPSFVEHLLMIVESMTLVRSFYAHADTAEENTVHVFVECWTTRAAMEQLKRLSTSLGGEMAVTIMASNKRYYEGTSSQYEASEDFSHVLDA